MALDPYKAWLGIPDGERPPNHYALLGLERFESDPAVIQDAADQRTKAVRPLTLKYRELGTQLLNEIARARVTLLNKEKKQAYDDLLGDVVEASIIEVEAAPEAVLPSLMAGQGEQVVRVPARPVDRRVLQTFTYHKAAVSAVAFGANDSIFASGGLDGAIRLYDLARGRSSELKEPPPLTPGGQKKTLNTYRNPVTSLAFNPDGAMLASAGRSTTIRLWDVRNGTMKKTLAQPTLAGNVGIVNCVVFRSDGNVLASATSQTSVWLWNIGSGQVWSRMAAPSRSVAFSADGAMLASTDGLWSVSADARLLHPFGDDAGFVNCVAFCREENLLATGSLDCNVRLWNSRSGEMLRVLEKHQGAIHSVAFGPRGRLLASAGADGAICLWSPDADSPLLTLEGHVAAVNAVAFSPSGKTLLSGSSDRTVRLWNIAELVAE